MVDLLHPALHILHVLFACLALAAVLVSNVSYFNAIVTIRPAEIRHRTKAFHILIVICLTGLWLTGLTLAAKQYTFETLPQSIVIKMVLATVLMVSSYVFSNPGAHYAPAWPRPAVFRLTIRRLFRMVFCASLSLTCWIFAFIIALHDNFDTTAIHQILPWFALLWTFLATVISILIAIKFLLEPVLVRWFPGARIANQNFQHACPATAPETAHAASPVNVSVNAPNRKPAVSMARTLRSCVTALFGIFCISLVTNLLMLTGPLFMLQIYDRVMTSRSIPTLMALLALVGGLFLFLGILELLRSRILVRVGQRVDRQINEPVFQSVVSVAPSAAKQSKDGLLQDLDSVRQFFSSPAPTAMFDLPWTPLYFLVIFMFHWVLGLIAVAGAVVLLLVSLCNEFASRKSVAAASQLATRSSAFVEAGRRNAEILHAMAMFEPFRQRWLDIHRSSVSQQLKAADVSGTMSVISKVTRLFLQSLMLAAGAYFAVIGEVSAGVIVAASIILSRALAPIEQIVGQWRNILLVRQGFSRLAKVLSGQNHQQGQIKLAEPKGFLSAERLYAGPLGSREPVLKDLNFYVKPGDAVAVIGSNASGKSTLARALVGVWPALRGHIRLDGASLNQWQPQQLGRSIGYLPQDVELFEGTVAENISRFDPEATSEMILEAAKKAHVHDLITRLPEGYGTMLGEGGVTISGGQRQRIAFARALYGNPALIVLDEPNANLDNEGELALTAAISALRKESSTVIVMAHRPNVLSAVNLVLVLNNGRQVSFGDKAKVMNKNQAHIIPRPKERQHAKQSAQVFSVA